MEMNPTVGKYKNMQKQGIQRMNLIIVEYSANLKCFGFYVKPSLGQC